MLLFRLSFLLVIAVSTATNAFTINIEFLLDKNNSDPSLVDLFKKVKNVNATAIAQTPDKHIIRVDSVIIVNRTIDFFKNKFVVENEHELIKRLLELMTTNDSSSRPVTSSSSYRATNSRVTTSTRKTTTTKSSRNYLFDYELTNFNGFSDYSTEFEDSTLSTQLEVN